MITDCHIFVHMMTCLGRSEKKKKKKKEKHSPLNATGENTALVRSSLLCTLSLSQHTHTYITCGLVYYVFVRKYILPRILPRMLSRGF